MLLALGLGVLGSAEPTRAQSLVISPDKTSYHVGETVVVEILGDTGGLQDVGVFARLVFPSAILRNPSVVRDFTAPSPLWTDAPLDCRSTNCDVIDAVSLSPSSIGPPGVNKWATVTLTAMTPGTAELRFQTADFGNRLDFFGLTSAPAVTLTVTPAPVIPSLTPAAGLGLAAALAGAALLWLRRPFRHAR